MSRAPFKITKHVLNKIETLAAQGLAEYQIARCLGICPDTFLEKKKVNPGIPEAIKSGRAKGVGTVTNAMFDNAKNGNFQAQKYYLNNRDPENWQERTDIVHKADIQVTHAHIILSEVDRWITESLRGVEDGDTEETLPNRPVLPALENL